MNKNSSPYIKAFIIGILILYVLLSIYVGKRLLVYIEEPEAFRNWIDSFGFYAPLIYCLVTILQIMIPLIPGEPMELITGYAFGAIPGTLLCLFAESLGSIIVLYLVKRYGRKIVEVFFEKEKIDSLRFLHSSKNRIISFAIAFTAPGTPKDLLCFFAGLTDIDKKILIPIITIGRFPSIITSTLAGSHFGERKYLTAGLFIGIALVLSLIGIFIYKNIQKEKQA